MLFTYDSARDACPFGCEHGGPSRSQSAAWDRDADRYPQWPPAFTIRRSPAGTRIARSQSPIGLFTYRVSSNARTSPTPPPPYEEEERSASPVPCELPDVALGNPRPQPTDMIDLTIRGPEMTYRHFRIPWRTRMAQVIEWFMSEQAAPDHYTHLNTRLYCDERGAGCIRNEDTPHSLGLRPGDVLRISMELTSCTVCQPFKRDFGQPQRKRVMLTIHGLHGENEYMFGLQKDRPMSVVMDRWVEKTGNDVAYARFFWNRMAVKRNETPADLDLRNGDVIHAYISHEALVDVEGCPEGECRHHLHRDYLRPCPNIKMRRPGDNS